MLGVLLVLVLLGDARLDDFVLNLLHKLQELIERDLTIGIGIDVLDKFADFIRISLQASHDRLQVFHFDVARLFFVEKIKNFLEVLDLVIGETVKDLLFLLILVHLLLSLIAFLILQVRLLVRKYWAFLVGIFNLLVLSIIVILVLKMFTVCLL